MSSAPGAWDVGPAFTPQRADFGLAYDSGSNKLYALGGDLGNDGNFFNSTDEVDELDVSGWPGGTWNSPPNLPQPNRQANQAGFFGNGDIWSVGGLNGATFQFLNEVWHRSNGGGGCASPTPTPTVTATATATLLQQLPQSYSNYDRYRYSDGNLDGQTYAYAAPTADTETSPDAGAASIAHNADCKHSGGNSRAKLASSRFQSVGLERARWDRIPEDGTCQTSKSALQSLGKCCRPGAIQGKRAEKI